MQRNAAWNNVAGVILDLQKVENAYVHTKAFSQSPSFPLFRRLSLGNIPEYFHANYFQLQWSLDSKFLFKEETNLR